MQASDGVKLKEYIFENRVNVVHLAKALDVSRSSIYDWYKTGKIPTATKKAIADAIGAKVTEVWPYTTVQAMERQRETQGPTPAPDTRVDEIITMLESLTEVIEAHDVRLKKLEAQAIRKRPK